MERHENYFVWLFNQLKGWPVQNYCLWFFAFGFQLALLIQAKVTSVTLITFIGTLLGTLCVLAINATKAINGWLGLISAACFIYAGWSAKNYLSIFEQIAYIATLDLPVILSVRSWNNDTKNHLRKFGGREWIIAIVGTLAVYLVSGFLIGKFTNDPRPWLMLSVLLFHLLPVSCASCVTTTNTSGGLQVVSFNLFFGESLTHKVMPTWLWLSTH